MEQLENNGITVNNNSEEQLNQSEEAESSSRPSLSQVKKSWGFRRTTIARREFMDEVGQLAYSPPPVRRCRSLRTRQMPQTTSESCTANQRATSATKSVIDDLEWSAPSSPASEDSKPASEAFAGGTLDPILWQDFGSAFHTAFSLLGGGEGLSLEMPHALAVPEPVETTSAIEPPTPQAIDETEIPHNVETADDMELLHLVAPDFVAAKETDDVVLISGQEEDSDEMTLIQIKEQLASKCSQGETRPRGVKSGRGKVRRKGRGRGRKKGKGRGRGKGRAVELQLNIDDESDDEVLIVNTSEQQLEQEKHNDPVELETPTADFVVSLSPTQQSNSDCIYIESDSDQITSTPGQSNNALEEEEEKKDNINEERHPGILDSKGYKDDALCCICRQKHNNRFMICCDSCQEWFHGSCVGVSATEDCTMKRGGQEYICLPCTTKTQSQLQAEANPQLDPELSFPECLTQNRPDEVVKDHDEQQALKETEVLVVKEEEEKEAHEIRPEPEPEPEMKMASSLPLCIGPGCSKNALPDSVYCGTDCILQHAAVTMKTLSAPKVPKPRGQIQRKAATTRRTAKGQQSACVSKRLARKAEEEGEEDKEEDDGGQKEAASPLDPSLTEVQATSLPSSKSLSASKMDNKQVGADTEDVTPSTKFLEESSPDGAPDSQSATEPAMPQCKSAEKPNEPINSSLLKQESADSNTCILPNPVKTSPSSVTQSPSTSPRCHETGALLVTKTAYVIPKKQSAPQPLSSNVPASASCQKPVSGPTLLNETRNLLVPPAPSAPSSRPSQPNNQIRQSIQRSLTSILFKRVSDCEDLEMSESDVTKLVANIEMEMFDIFRNTDSKYMNKYRTIMFNLKDPRNKGLLYRVVFGEISPFRLVRMSQKDMQAIKASESGAKEKTEVKDAAVKAKLSFLPKPEAVKVDLPSLNPVKPDKNVEQKKSLPVPALKAKTSQPSQTSTVPDTLTCMLKDTTSEHKTHLFDLKCKICTGQIPATDEQEPSKKKRKISETRDKQDPSWRKFARDDSPLRAPPDSPDMDSPTLSLTDPSSRLIIDSPVLTIAESPASPIMDSPASPTLESPASPVMESPASPTPDTPKATTTKRAYTPVVIPAVSTVTITRRDPRTAASRFSVQSSGSSGPSNTNHNQTIPYAPLNETRLAPLSTSFSSQPHKKILPKSILMKPTSSADPRISRTMISDSPADDETTNFLAKQDIVWKGFLNMLTVAKFVSKGYLVSGSAENLKADLPDTIQIGGRIMPETVWDYVAKLKTSVTKELCVIRFHPATEEEEVAYVSLFSYFSSRGRFGVVANGSRSIKDLYLVPLSAKESIPSILQPLEGPGLEIKRPNLLLGLAITQKAKRPGSFPQETEEKRPRVQLSKDPMWIPKPPVLYGSDKLEIFQPYDPETPANTTPPGSPSCPGSLSETSSSDSLTIPSVLTSIRKNPSVSSQDTPATSHSTSNNIYAKNPITASSEKTPLQTILNSLFGNKETDSMISNDENSTKTTGGNTKLPAFSQVSGPMVDPIVQQYGQKSKVEKIEEEENDFDRPYDPEEEYDPAVRYGMVTPKSIEKKEADGKAQSGFVDDDVAYDPEDETIFADIQTNIVVKPHAQTQISDSPPCPTPVSTQPITPALTSTTMPTSSSGGVTQNLPTGTVVVSAATLTEQQRMLEELNKQIEEQKRQLKEQEEALRQQREAVGMFMAHFSVSDSLMSPPTKSLPLNQMSSLQSGMMQAVLKPSELTDKTSNLTETVDSSNVDLQTVKIGDTTSIPNLKNDADIEQDETRQNVKESDRYSSAGEIEDSDVAYDPEDESLFDEIQETVFQGDSKKTNDTPLSRTGRSSSHKGTPQNSHHSRKRRLSPKRRGHRERGQHRSPSKKTQRHSPSHSQRRRERDRHRRSDRERSRHRVRDQSERRSRHRKDPSVRRHSHSHTKSPSFRPKDSMPLSPKYHRTSPTLLEKSSTVVSIKDEPDGHLLKCNHVESPDEDHSAYSHELLHDVKLEISEQPTSEELQRHSVSHHDDIDRGSSTHVTDPPQQETLIENKIESIVPLRVIDPPVRDSPESPDPEPQFVKAMSIEKNDDVNTEKIGDPEIYTSVSMPLDETENKCLPSGGQVSLSKIQWPTFRGPGPEHIHCSGPETDPVIKHPGLDKSDASISNPETYIPQRYLNPTGPQIFLRETEIRFLGPDMRVQGMQCLSSSISVPGLHIQNNLGTERNISEAGVQHLSTALGPVFRGSGMSIPAQGLESSSMQSMNPKVKGLVGHKTEEHRSQLENPNGRPGVMEIGSDKYFTGPQIKDRVSDIGGGRSQDDRHEIPNAVGLSSVVKGDFVRDQNPGPPSFVGSERVQMHSGQDGNQVLEQKRGPQKMDSQLYGRDTDIGMVGCGMERNLDSNTSTGTDLRLDPQRGRDLPVIGHGSDRNFEKSGSNMSFSGQDSSGPRKKFMESRPNLMSDVTERGFVEHGQDTGSMGGSEISCNRGDSHVRSLGQEIGPNKRDADIQGGNIHSHLDRRNEKMAQERVSIPNITNQNQRGPGPGVITMRAHRTHNRAPGSHMRDPDWSGSGSVIQDERREPDRRGSNPGRGGPFIQDEWRVHQSDRSPNIEDLTHDRNGTAGPDFIASKPDGRGSDIEVPEHDRRGPRGSNFRRPVSERGGPNNVNQGPGMRGPGGLSFEAFNRRGPTGADFRRPWPDRGGPVMEPAGTDRQGPQCPDFSEPLPERGGLSMEGPVDPDFRDLGPDRRGPGGPEYRGLYNRNVSIDGIGPNRRGLEGPDFRGPGPDRRGSAGQDFRGPGPDVRDPSMSGMGPDRSGPGDPEFRGPQPVLSVNPSECSGPDRRGPGGQDFSKPGPDMSFPTTSGLGPDSMGHRGPEFRGPGSERRVLEIGGLRTNRRGPRGQNFSGLQPVRRGPVMGCLGPEKMESRVPDFSRQGCETSDHTMDNQEPDRKGPGDQDFHDQGPERRRMVMDEPRPNNRGQAGPELRGTGCDWRGPSMLSQGPDRRAPGNQNPGGVGSDKRGPYMRGPGPDFIGLRSEQPDPGLNSREQGGPPFRISEPECGYQNMDGPETDRRGQNIREIRTETPGSGMEGPRPNRRGPGGPNMRRPGFQHSGQNMEGPVSDRRGPEGPNFREPGWERRLPQLEETEFPVGPQFRGPEPERPPVMEGRVSDRGGPHLRGVRPEGAAMEGHVVDWKGLRGPDVRTPGCENRGPDFNGPGHDRQELGGPRFREPGSEMRGPDMESSGTEWKRSGGPGPGIRQRHPSIEGQGHKRDQWEGTNFGGSVPIHLKGPEPDQRSQNLRGPGQMRRNIRRPGPALSSLNQGDRWNVSDFRGSTPDRHSDEQWSDERGPCVEAVGNEREYSSNDWKRHGYRGPRPIFEGPDELAQEHSCQGPPMEWTDPGNRGPKTTQERPNMQGRGPRDDWSGSHFKVVGPVRDDPDIVYPEPSSGESGNEWREPDRGNAGPNRWGPGHFFRGIGESDIREQGHNRRVPSMRGPRSDMGNEYRQSDCRGNVREPNMERPEGQRGGPTRPELRCPGPDNRHSNIDGPGTDGRFSDSRGLRSGRQGVNMESPGSNRTGFDDFKGRRRGPDTRRLRPDKMDTRGITCETSGLRHGPGRWDTITEGSGLDLSGCEPALPHFNSPHQDTRFLCPSSPDSLPSGGPLGPPQNSGGNLYFDNQQNQQAVKPQRHRGALLPTPTEGPIRLPNRMMNNPNKQIGHSMDRGWRRGRHLNKERQLVKGQKQVQEKNPVDKTSTHADVLKVSGEQNKEGN